MWIHVQLPIYHEFTTMNEQEVVHILYNFLKQSLLQKFIENGEITLRWSNIWNVHKRNSSFYLHVYISYHRSVTKTLNLVRNYQVDGSCL